MIVRIFTLLCMLLLLSSSAIAQEVWGLEKCINYALQNSLSIKQSQISVRNSELSEKQYKMARLPNLNASSDLGLQFGRTIDPTTNTFDNQSITSNRWSLTAGMNVYNGSKNNNLIRQSQVNKQAAQADAEYASNTLALNVAQNYLQILLAEEQLEIARKRLKQTQDQLTRTDKLIQAGTLAQSSRLDIVAQAARDEQNLVASQNNVEITYLNLKQLLQLEPDFNLKIEKPEVLIPEANPEAFGLKAIYNQALNNQPQIRAGEFKLKSASLGVNIARAGLLPSVSLFGNLNSNYSSLGEQLTGQFNEFVVVNDVTVNDVPVTIKTNQRQYLFEKTPFFKQLDENFGQSVGLSVSIPIYNNHQNLIAIERAQLNIQQQVLSNQQTEQQLKSDIQTAIANSRAAKKQLEASQKTFDSVKAAFENTEKRFQLGAVNSFEFTTARNNLDSAENDLAVSKYDYLFKLKIVDFYQGKQLKLK